MQTTLNKPNGFLKLPYELRLSIYETFFESLLRTTDEAVIQNSMAVLFVSRNILNECMASVREILQRPPHRKE